MIKQIIITFIVFWLFQFWFALPKNKTWWEQRISVYYKDYKKEKIKTKWEKRWEERHGYNYLVPKQIAQNLSEEKDTLLLPPKKYFIEAEPNLEPFLQWLDPRWFYYMAEKKIHLANLTDEWHENSTHTVLYSKNTGFSLQRLDKQNVKDSLLDLFKKNL